MLSQRAAPLGTMSGTVERASGGSSTRGKHAASDFLRMPHQTSHNGCLPVSPASPVVTTCGFFNLLIRLIPMPYLTLVPVCSFLHARLETSIPVQNSLPMSTIRTSNSVLAQFLGKA